MNLGLTREAITGKVKSLPFREPSAAGEATAAVVTGEGEGEEEGEGEASAIVATGEGEGKGEGEEITLATQVCNHLVLSFLTFTQGEEAATTATDGGDAPGSPSVVSGVPPVIPGGAPVVSAVVPPVVHATVPAGGALASSVPTGSAHHGATQVCYFCSSCSLTSIQVRTQEHEHVDVETVSGEESDPYSECVSLPGLFSTCFDNVVCLSVL